MVVHIGGFSSAADGFAGDVAIFADGAQEVVDAVGDVFAVFAFAGELAAGEEGHEGVTCHGDGMFAAGGPGAGRGLLAGEVLEGALENLFGVGIDGDFVTLGGSGGWGGKSGGFGLGEGGGEGGGEDKGGEDEEASVHV